MYSTKEHAQTTRVLDERVVQSSAAEPIFIKCWALALGALWTERRGEVLARSVVAQDVGYALAKVSNIIHSCRQVRGEHLRQIPRFIKSIDMSAPQLRPGFIQCYWRFHGMVPPTRSLDDLRRYTLTLQPLDVGIWVWMREPFGMRQQCKGSQATACDFFYPLAV
jgi:hypothetical protein